MSITDVVSSPEGIFFEIAPLHSMPEKDLDSLLSHLRTGFRERKLSNKFKVSFEPTTPMRIVPYSDPHITIVPSDIRRAYESIHSTLAEKGDLYGTSFTIETSADVEAVIGDLSRPFTYVQSVDSLRNVIARPLKNAYHEIDGDMTIAWQMRGKHRTMKAFAAGTLGFSLIIPAHEGLHAIANHATGGTNGKMVFNRWHGGDIWAAVIPGAEAKNMIPGVVGAYVEITNVSVANRTAPLIAPYALTPIGCALLMYSQRRKSPVAAALGTGIVVAHAGGVYGDFKQLGYMAVTSTANTITNKNYELIKPTTTSLPISILSIYAGMKIIDFTYRASRAIGKPIAGLIENGIDRVSNWYKTKTTSS